MLQHFFTFKIYKYNDYVTTAMIKYEQHNLTATFTTGILVKDSIIKA